MNVEIKDEIQCELQKVACRLAGTGAHNNVWTTQSKQCLVDLGRKHGFYVAAHGCNNSNWGEWLFDITWIDYDWLPTEDGRDGTFRHLRRVALALECEWGNFGDILDDFEKLLVARAELRVMIFQAANAERMEEVIDRLCEMIQNFDVSEPGDDFLLIGYDNTLQDFVRRSLQVPKLGHHYTGSARARDTGH